MFLLFNDDANPSPRSGRNVSDPLVVVAPLPGAQQLIAINFDYDETVPARVLIPTPAPTTFRYGRAVSEWIGKVSACFPDAVLPPAPPNIEAMPDDEREDAIEHQLDLAVPATPTIASA